MASRAVSICRDFGDQVLRSRGANKGCMMGSDPEQGVITAHSYEIALAARLDEVGIMRFAYHGRRILLVERCASQGRVAEELNSQQACCSDRLDWRQTSR